MEWLADRAAVISALDGFVELMIAVLIAAGIRRRLHTVPLVAILVIGYFLLEAALSFNRMFVESDFEGTLARTAVIEVLGTLVVVVVLLNVRAIVDAVTYVIDRANVRAAEYERARRHYTQVVRHRINNPLTVIKGAAQTLESETIAPQVRIELRRAIIDAAEKLEQISLAPERQGEEERDLDAVPRDLP